MQIKNSQKYLLWLSRNQTPRGFALVNPTTNQKIDFPLFALALQIVLV